MYYSTIVQSRLGGEQTYLHATSGQEGRVRVWISLLQVLGCSPSGSANNVIRSNVPNPLHNRTQHGSRINLMVHMKCSVHSSRVLSKSRLSSNPNIPRIWPDVHWFIDYVLYTFYSWSPKKRSYIFVLP